MKKLITLLGLTLLFACTPEEDQEVKKCNCVKIVQTKNIAQNSQWTLAQGSGQEQTTITDCNRNGEVLWESQLISNQIYRHILSCK